MLSVVFSGLALAGANFVARNIVVYINRINYLLANPDVSEAKSPLDIYTELFTNSSNVFWYGLAVGLLLIAIMFSISVHKTNSKLNILGDAQGLTVAEHFERESGIAMIKEYCTTREMKRKAAVLLYMYDHLNPDNWIWTSYESHTEPVGLKMQPDAFKAYLGDYFMHDAWTALYVGYRPLLIILIIGMSFIGALIALLISASTEFKLPTRILGAISCILLLLFGLYTISIVVFMDRNPVAYKQTDTKVIYEKGKTDTINITLSDNDSNQSDTYKIDTANLPIRLATTKRHANLEIGNKNIDLDKVIVKGNVNDAEVTKVEVKESKIAYKTYLGNWEYETNIATVYSK